MEYWKGHTFAIKEYSYIVVNRQNVWKPKLNNSLGSYTFTICVIISTSLLHKTENIKCDALSIVHVRQTFHSHLTQLKR